MCGSHTAAAHVVHVEPRHSPRPGEGSVHDGVRDAAHLHGMDWVDRGGVEGVEYSADGGSQAKMMSPSLRLGTDSFSESDVMMGFLGRKSDQESE